MEENSDKKQNSKYIQWEELDQIVRKWAIMSQWQGDIDRYESLKEEYDENVYRGYN